MKTIEVLENQKEQWNKFVQTYSLDGGLMQSWQWGEFKINMGQKVFRLAVIEQDNFIATALIIKQRLPLGKNYLYIPRGPIINSNWQLQTAEILEELFKDVKQKAQIEKSIFLKAEPTHLPADNLINLVFKKSNVIQPQETLTLNLHQPVNDLLKKMKQKTRYNIRLAEKKGVKVRVGEEKDLKHFLQLIEGTAKRQKINNFPKEYYQQLYKVLSSEGILKLYLAEVKGKVVAANLVAFFGSFAYYLFGGQSYHYRELMAPHLLQWMQIIDAKAQGKKVYDFWGASSTKKSWQGITRFKTGFLPDKEFERYFGGYDYAYRPLWYFLYRIVKKLKV